MEMITLLLCLIAAISMACVSEYKVVAYPARLMVVYILFIMLTGCASVEHSAGRVSEDSRDVVSTVPDAVGAVAGAAIFGGTVSMVPAPEDYLADSVDREGRVIYNESRRAVQKTVSDIFRAK